MKTTAHFVRVSGNSKTGPIPTLSYPRQSCPTDCPLKDATCYVETGYYTRLNWNKLDDGSRGGDFADVMREVKRLPNGTLIRDKVAGDEYAERDNPDNIDADLFSVKMDAFKGKRVISYTHRKPNAHNLKLLRKARDMGVAINLSADGVADADKKARHGLPVAVVVPSDTPKVSTTPKGRKVVVCPAQTNDRTTCATCGLCAKGDRDYMIGFRAHGNGKKKIDAGLSASPKSTA